MPLPYPVLAFRVGRTTEQSAGNYDCLMNLNNILKDILFHLAQKRK
jgi:hypothetical protein